MPFDEQIRAEHSALEQAVLSLERQRSEARLTYALSAYEQRAAFRRLLVASMSAVLLVGLVLLAATIWRDDLQNSGALVAGFVTGVISTAAAGLARIGLRAWRTSAPEESSRA